MKFLYAIILLIVYLLLLLLIYILYVNYFKIDVLLYSSILCVLFTLIIFIPILFFRSQLKIFNLFEKICIINICGLIGFLLAISLPTVIDRSLSFYILEKLNQRGGGIKVNKLYIVFTKEYVKEHKLIDIRVTEQLKTKSVIIENDCLRLTERGETLVKFSTFFRKYFLPKKRLIGEKYSDDLVFPLKEKSIIPDYLC